VVRRQIVLELVELHEIEVARYACASSLDRRASVGELYGRSACGHSGMLRQSDVFVALKGSDPERLLRLEHLLSKSVYDPRDVRC
jgi:hypothetical protein